jgi:hypothetical protein
VVDHVVSSVLALERLAVAALIAWTGAATGTAFLLLTVGFAAYECWFLSHSLTTEGKIVANIRTIDRSDEQSNSSATYCPQFQYTSSDSIVHTATSNACSNPPAFKLGQAVQVHYSKSNFADPQTDSFGAKWGLTLGFGIGTAIMLPIGLLLLTRLRAQGHPLGYKSLYS